MGNSIQESRVVAALDIGSNSVRLLVAEARGGILLPFFQDRVTSRLFGGLINGMLSEDAIERTATAIERLTGEAREKGATQVWAFGTSAMRDGKNTEALTARAEAVGVQIEVLSGEAEAEISFAGVKACGRTGMIDIGGGSTELLVGEGGRVLCAASAQLGAVRFMQDMEGLIEPTKLLRRAECILLSAWTALEAESAPTWIGLGGTITTLAAMELKLSEYDPKRIERQPVTAEKTRIWFSKLCTMSMDERRAIPGLNPARADILPYGVAILGAFFSLSGAEQVFASDRDNLLGYLMKKIGERVDKPQEMR